MADKVKQGKRWNKLGKIDCSHDSTISNPVLLNSNTLLFHIDDRLITYDIFTNQCNKIMSCDGIKSSDQHGTIALDPKHEEVYLLNSYGSLRKFDLINKNTERLELDIEYLISGCCTLCIEDEFHIVGGDSNNNHYVLDKNNSLKVLHEFDTSLDGHGLLYLPKKQIIITMGGYSVEIDEGIDHIMFYKINEKKWNLMDLQLTVEMEFGCIATKDERYLITFGGEDVHLNRFDDIIIYDIEKKSKSLSIVRCPEKSTFHAILSSNTIEAEMICYGFIRVCWKSDEFKDINYISEDLIKLIMTWYDSEIVYLKTRHENTHWIISLSEILLHNDSI